MRSARDSNKPAPRKQRSIWAAGEAGRSVLQYQTSAAADVPFSSEECSGLHPGASPIALIRFTLAVTRTCKKQLRYSLKRKPERTRPNSDEAGGPHPLTHRASRLLWGRSRLSHAQRVTHLAASQSGSFGVVRQRPLHPVREKVRTRIKASAVRSQDGNLPRFMMSRASKASWTSMPNSVMILVSLTVAPSWLRRCPEKKNF